MKQAFGCNLYTRLPACGVLQAVCAISACFQMMQMQLLLTLMPCLDVEHDRLGKRCQVAGWRSGCYKLLGYTSRMLRCASAHQHTGACTPAGYEQPGGVAWNLLTLYACTCTVKTSRRHVRATCPTLPYPMQHCQGINSFGFVRRSLQHFQPAGDPAIHRPLSPTQHARPLHAACFVQPYCQQCTNSNRISGRPAARAACLRSYRLSMVHRPQGHRFSDWCASVSQCRHGAHCAVPAGHQRQACRRPQARSGPWCKRARHAACVCPKGMQSTPHDRSVHLVHSQKVHAGMSAVTHTQLH